MRRRVDKTRNHPSRFYRAAHAAFGTDGRAVADLQVLANLIPGGGCVHGPKPTSVDAGIYGFIANIYFFDIDTPLNEVITIVAQSPYSRLPVYRDSLDNVVGILHTKELVRWLTSDGNDRSLTSVMRPISSVHESVTADRLLRHFRERRAHQALVVDQPQDGRDRLAPRFLYLPAREILGHRIQVIDPALGIGRDYAVANKDQVPLGYMTQQVPQKQWNYIANYNRGTTVYVTLMGVLEQAKMLKAPRTFYCPSEGNPQWQFNTPINPWPFQTIPAGAGNDRQTRLGYGTRPVVVWPDPTVAANRGRQA